MLSEKSKLWEILSTQRTWLILTAGKILNFSLVKSVYSFWIGWEFTQGCYWFLFQDYLPDIVMICMFTSPLCYVFLDSERKWAQLYRRKLLTLKAFWFICPSFYNCFLRLGGTIEKHLILCVQTFSVVSWKEKFFITTYFSNSNGWKWLWFSHA